MINRLTNENQKLSNKLSFNPISQEEHKAVEDNKEEVEENDWPIIMQSR
jgi:hypothetical protein